MKAFSLTSVLNLLYLVVLSPLQYTWLVFEIVRFWNSDLCPYHKHFFSYLCIWLFKHFPFQRSWNILLKSEQIFGYVDSLDLNHCAENLLQGMKWLLSCKKKSQYPFYLHFCDLEWPRKPHHCSFCWTVSVLRTVLYWKECDPSMRIKIEYKSLSCSE